MKWFWGTSDGDCSLYGLLIGQVLFGLSWFHEEREFSAGIFGLRYKKGETGWLFGFRTFRAKEDLS